LWLDFEQDSIVENYRRDLDLTTAISSTTYKKDGIKFTRKAFINHPSKVMMVELDADQKGSLDLQIRLTSKLKSNTKVAENKLELKGKTPYYVAARDHFADQVLYDEEKGLGFHVEVQVQQVGGQQVV